MTQDPNNKESVWLGRIKKAASVLRKIRWGIALFVAISAPLVIFSVVGCASWDQYFRFILLNATIIFLLFILHFHQKFWRENRWIVMSSAVVLVTWMIAAWGQSCLSVESLESLKIFPSPGSRLGFSVAYPNRILYDTTEIPSISIWRDCPARACANIKVKLISDNAHLQFALQNDAPIWQETFSVILPGDGSEKVILLRRPSLSGNQKAHLKVLMTDTNVPHPIGAILVEGAWEAKWRNFWLNLFGTGSVVITLIAAVFAGLKQIDEQKRNERKKKIDDFIHQTNEYKYERGKVEEFLEDSLIELNDWSDWESVQKKNYRSAFSRLIDKVSRKATAQETFSPEPSAWIQPAEQIIEKLQYEEDARIILARLNLAPRFQLEKYLLQRQFVQRAVSALPQSGTWGMESWRMRFAPFDDNAHPFLYVQDGAFPLLEPVNFPFDKNRFTHQSYYFQNTWDLRAGYYQYCRTFDISIGEDLRGLSQRTFFVPVLAEEIPPWAETVNFEEHFLHNLAAAWLRLLADNPSIADEINLIQMEAIGRLLVWHYGSASAVQSLSLSPNARILQHLQVIKPEKTLGVGDPISFLSLRPPGADQTLYLFAEISPAGKSDERALVSLPEKSAKAFEAANLHVACFLLVVKIEQAKALKMSNADLKELLNKRIRLSSSERVPAFEDLFFPAAGELMDDFISRANGSPGKIIQMAHSLMERHIQQLPDTPEIPPEALLE